LRRFAQPIFPIAQAGQSQIIVRRRIPYLAQNSFTVSPSRRRRSFTHPRAAVRKWRRGVLPSAAGER